MDPDHQLLSPAAEARIADTGPWRLALLPILLWHAWRKNIPTFSPYVLSKGSSHG